MWNRPQKYIHVSDVGYTYNFSPVHRKVANKIKNKKIETNNRKKDKKY